MFIKNVSNRTEAQIRNEVELQKRAARKGFAPKVIITDYKTYIKMDKIDLLCIADQYGAKFTDTAKHLRDQIYEIVRRLYYECDIEYIDVTPYNFIEDTTGRVWVIDFGDALPVKRNWFLEELLENGILTKWNPDFK
jgi:RIO-like serine/threonine protein kinase